MHIVFQLNPNQGWKMEKRDGLLGNERTENDLLTR